MRIVPGLVTLSLRGTVHENSTDSLKKFHTFADMASVYIHIPFCKKACSYCDFHFSVNLSGQELMVEAILKEIQVKADFFPPGTTLDSLYFGGGTPSVLSSAHLHSIIEAVCAYWPLKADAEVTLEANPDDISESCVQELSGIGINRLSIGIQSFHSRDLLLMNRSHTLEQAMSATESARKGGIHNITLDLIFGLPNQTTDDFRQNLETLIQIQPDHASVYSLTIEERTAFAHYLKKGTITIPEDDEYAAQFALAHELLTSAGYEHYELSNYARPGYRARHNSAYWSGNPYLGIGPSAHSYDGQKRSWNVANNAKYQTAVNASQPAIVGSEILSLTDRYHEYVMLGLRTERGINSSTIEQEFIRDWKDRFRLELDTWIKKGVLLKQQDQYILSPEGWFISDRVAADFFLEED